MGRRPKATDLNGVLVVDKPAGPTSHDVVAELRRLMKQPRAGHTGTLDPPATGLLVVCFGKATKLVQYLQASTKEYVADVVFGVETDTLDADGEVTAERDASALTADAVAAAATDFLGAIEQIPPMVSAIKVDGKRLHELAREGKTVERKPRPVTIDAIQVSEFAAGERASARMTVRCSPGTYIRTLAADIGTQLGTGASLTSLRRTGHGAFTETDAVQLEPLRDIDDLEQRRSHLRDIDDVLAGWAGVDVDLTEAQRLANGGKLTPFGTDEPWVARHDGRVVGFYKDRPDRGDAKAETVLLQPADFATTEA